jgi:excisionase family DNA binding protein
MNTSIHRESLVDEGVLLDTLQDTQRKLKLGRTKIYELINGGHLQVVKVGRNTRIVASSTHRFVTNLLSHQS